MKLTKKILKFSIGIILGLLVLVVSVPIPININAHAAEITLNDDCYLKERTVRIRGWYSFNFFASGHTFRGTIEILEYPETGSELVFSPLRLTPVGASARRGVRMEMLHYTSQLQTATIPTSSIEVYEAMAFGVIYTTAFFRNFTIVVSDDGVISHSESPIIVPRATTREQALEQLSLILNL